MTGRKKKKQHRKLYLSLYCTAQFLPKNFVAHLYMLGPVSAHFYTMQLSIWV